MINALASDKAGEPLKEFNFDPGPIGSEEVEVKVEYCGLCHSDLSCIDDEWDITQFPIVPGHEIVGHVTALGEHAKGLEIGQRVGIGWNASSCHSCKPCVRGDQHLCSTLQPTIVGHHGGFADKVRANWLWAVPIPDALDSAQAAPLLCAGNTVFPPFLDLGIKPTDNVGVVGIGGLGHLALQFANAWGCEVTAFSSSESKYKEIKQFGAHNIVSSRDSDAIKAAASSLDYLFITTNVNLDWDSLMDTLKPGGQIHFLGVVLDRVPVSVVNFIFNQRALSAAPTGSPSQISDMLEFAARHGVGAEVQEFPMSQANEALDAMRNGKINYRAVLKA